MLTVLFITSLIILILGSMVASGLSKGILSLSIHELRARARSGQVKAKLVYPLRMLNRQLYSTFLIITTLINVALVVLLASRLPSIVAVLVATMVILLFSELLPLLYLRNQSVSIAARLAVPLRYVIAFFAPIARPISKIIDKRLGNNGPGLHSKEELFTLLEQQRQSEFTDIKSHEIEIVKHALSFGIKQVREVMTPRKVVVSVSADEAIGPILIDELHRSGFSRFPVHDPKKKEQFIGTLYLHDLVGLQAGGKVADVMKKAVYYLHEEERLDKALQAFLKTNHHLFVVVNSFEEFVGVISFEDVLEQILGQQIVDEFDQHADLRAVAKSIAEREKKAREKAASTSKK